jgi:hypothetical protein
MSSHHDEILFDEATTSVCDCCGHTTTSLVRYVYRQDTLFACYFAMFSTGPKHFYVDGFAVFGPWGDEPLMADRTSLFFRMWAEQHRPTVMLIDADASPYKGQLLGIGLSRAEALVHPLKQELFDLTDHINLCDLPIIDFLAERSLDHPP